MVESPKNLANISVYGETNWPLDVLVEAHLTAILFYLIEKIYSNTMQVFFFAFTLTF